MIIRCPICGKHLELPDGETIEDGQRVLCPFCNEKFYYNSRSCNQRIDEDESFSDQNKSKKDVDTSEENASIKCPPLMNLMEDEHLVLVTRPSWFHYFVGLALGILCMLSSLNGCAGNTPINVALVAFLDSVFLGSIILILTISRRNTTYYILTNKRVLIEIGIFRKRLTEVWLNDIRGVSTSIGIIQKELGLGTVIVRTASMCTIRLYSVEYYSELEHRINALRSNRD